MTNTKSTFVKKIKRMSRKAPVRIVALVLAVLLVMNVTSILTNLSVFAQTQEDYAVIGIEMNGKTSVVEYRAKDDCSLVVAVYDDDGAKMLGSGNTTVSADKQSAEVEISIDEMPQHYFVKAFLVNPANNYPLCCEFIYQNVTLSNLKADEEYFICGKDNVITFTVDVTGSPDSVYLYKNDTELVGEMYDDGLNGDKTAGDGQFTCVINETISEDETTTIDYFAKSADKISGEFTIYFFEQLTEESQNKIIHTQEQIQEIESLYINSDGYIAIDKVSSLISSVSDYISTRNNSGDVLSYEINETNILIRFSSGFLMLYAPEVESFESSGSNVSVSVVTCQPCYDSLPNSVFDSAANCISDSLSNYSFMYNYDNDDVTLNTLRSVFTKNSVVLWNGHGGYSKTYHSYLLTGERCDSNIGVVREIFDFFGIDNTQGRIIPCSNGKVAFTSKYIDKYCNSMTNSFIWLGACESGRDNVLASSFINKGAKSVVGFSKTVKAGYDRSITDSTIRHMLEINNTTKNYNSLYESLELAKMENGATDRVKYSDALGATAKIYGKDYRFTNAGTLSGTICKDTNNATIPDAEIYISDLNNKAMLSRCMKISNSKGKFTAYLPSGNYTITVHASGYSWNRTTAIVKENQTTSITVKLSDKTEEEECPWDDLPDDDWSDDIFDPGDLSDDVEVGLCGNQVRWNFSRGTGTLTLSGKGATYDYASADDVPWKNLRDSITSVEIDKNITYLGDRLFEYCSKIKNVNIPNKVSGIGESVFFECKSLTKVEIPSSVVYLGKTAFYNCTGLQSVSISYGLQTIGEFAFGKCSEITQISIPNSVTKIEKEAFSECTNLQSVKLPDSLSEIAEKLFYKCSNLTNVTLPDTISTIGVNAFRKCQKITEISIPDSTISIKDGAFYECSALKNVSFGNSLKSIGEWAFSYSGVTSISFPDSIESVGGKCFFRCYSLKKVIIPDSLQQMGGFVFQDCSGLTSAGPLGSESSIEFGWITKIPDNAFNCSAIKRIDIPDTVEEIGDSTFRSCENLTEIHLPDNLRKIGESCFGWGCYKLKHIDIPDGVTYIGHDAFDGCYALDEIVLPDSITKINGLTFGYCYALKRIVIPQKVTLIDYQAFDNCKKLEKVYIPKSVKRIEDGCFRGCDKSKLVVYYEGSQADWNKISIHPWDNDVIKSIVKIYNSSKDDFYNSNESESGNPNASPNPSVPGTLSATFDNLIPNANYLFVVSKSSDLDNMLDASNLLFIDEKTAGDSGSLTFSYIPREDYEGAVVKIFGPVNPSVTLDTTSATLKKGDKLTITAMVDQGHSANDVVWSSSNDKIARVSKGQVTAVGFGDAEISARLDDCVVKCVVSVVPDLDFTILGASIRLSEPYGIRFGIQLGKGGDYTNVKIIEYGTLMKPTQLLGDEELTLQTAKIQKIPSTVTYSETDAALVYTGVLINIPTTYFNTAVSGRGYFIYEDENGVNHTIYTDTVSMSFNDVVEAAYNKYSKLTNPTDAQKVVLQKLEKLRALNGNN